MRRRSYKGRERPTRVYIAFAVGIGGAYVKVGMSCNVHRRVKQLVAPSGEKPHSLYVSSVSASDVALAYEVEHDILQDTISHQIVGEWRYFPVWQGGMFERILDRAEYFLRLSISPDATMERVDIQPEMKKSA